MPEDNVTPHCPCCESLRLRVVSITERIIIWFCDDCGTITTLQIGARGCLWTDRPSGDPVENNSIN